MITRARLEGESWVLNGTKAWITNSGGSEWYTVMAVNDPERAPTASPRSPSTGTTRASPLAPRNARWASRARRHASCTSPTAPSRPTGSSGRRALASRPRFEPWTSLGPPSARGAVGVAQGALDAAVEYTRERKEFGRAISDNQGVQFVLADMSIQIEAARSS
ncbi:acyl-CoA dehydrogenase family protein [Geodermatophilus sp. URMC 64]